MIYQRKNAYQLQKEDNLIDFKKLYIIKLMLNCLKTGLENQ